MKHHTLPAFLLPAVLVAALLSACGQTAATSTPDDTGLADGAADDALAPADTATATDASTDATTSVGPTLPPGPPLPEERGWRLARTVVHIHSAYSHDACDGEIDETGVANPTCLQQFRTALCNAMLDVAYVTDHPAHMKEYPFTALLQYHPELGDVLVGPKDAPYGNIVQCPAADKVPAHELVLTEGYEATHIMPVGLHRHVTPDTLEGGSLADDVTLSQAKALVDAAHDAGGLVVNAHSEEAEISAQRLIDAGVDAMEIYNIHANFLTVLGGGGGKANIGRIFELDAFFGPKETSPWPDLLVMLMLDVQPEAAFQKWQEVLGQKFVTAVVGNDTHQNVKLDGYCTPGGSYESLCDSMADTYPNLVKVLKAGGAPYLADGERLDSYKRQLRIISDRALIPAATTTPDRVEVIKTALKDGRNWVWFDLMGEPEHVDFVAKSGDQWVEMGGTANVGDTLWLRTPLRCVPDPWAPWQEADTRAAGDEATVRTLVWFIAPGAKTGVVVKEVAGFAKAESLVADKPGRYHVEVRLTPKHLRSWLHALGKYADMEQRWAVSNAVTVVGKE